MSEENDNFLYDNDPMDFPSPDEHYDVSDDDSSTDNDEGEEYATIDTNLNVRFFAQSPAPTPPNTGTGSRQAPMPNTGTSSRQALIHPLTTTTGSTATMTMTTTTMTNGLPMPTLNLSSIHNGDTASDYDSGTPEENDTTLVTFEEFVATSQTPRQKKTKHMDAHLEQEGEE